MNSDSTTAVCDLLKRPYARLLTPAEDGTYTAEILEFSGCYAEGDTAEEAIANLESAAASWIEAALEQGQEIPSPIAAHGYSGKIHLRLAKSIHKQAARFAERDETSLNQFFATAIAARVGAEEFYEHLAQRLLDLSMPMFAVTFVNIQKSANEGFMLPAEMQDLVWQVQETKSLSSEDSIPVDPAKVTSNG
jgi:predicted RNase H-like HicB family nuclease